MVPGRTKRAASRGCRLAALAVLASTALAPVAAVAGGQVGTSFPADFPVPVDASLGKPVIGFGAAGTVTRTPVVFLHGNNDTPYPTTCNGSLGHVRNFAQHFLDRGYEPAEIWGLGYQGDQCDLLTSPTNKSGHAHSTEANVPDLRAFVDAVLRYTGASQVDIVGHSLGGTLPREWLRQDRAYAKVRRLVMVDSPHHGIINCSPGPQNYFALAVNGGFGPDSAICQEYGAADTPLLAALNADPVPGPTQYLSIYNADTSFVFFSKQDGVFPPVPAQDRHGRPHDFSRSARLDGGRHLEVSGQGAFDPAYRTAHIGISNSPEVWRAAFDFLAGPAPTPGGGPTQAAASAGGRGAGGAGAGPRGEPLPATGGSSPLVPAALAALAALVARRAR